MLVKKTSGWRLSSRVRLVIALIFAMLVALLLANNFYFFKIINDNALNDQKNAMKIYAEQLEISLRSATTTLGELAGNYSKDIASFDDARELQRYFATMDMARLLETKMAANPFLSCIFFASPSRKLALTRFNPNLGWSRKIALTDSVKATATYDNDVIDENWHVVRIGDSQYMLQVFSLNGVNIGALARLDDFLLNIEGMSGQTRDQYVFADGAGKILASGNGTLLDENAVIPTGQELIRDYKTHFFIISLPIGKTPVRLALIKNRGDISSGIDTVQYLLIAFSLIALVVLSVSSVFVNRYIIVPLKKLFEATKEVEKGNLDFRIPETDSSLEYKTLIHSFNNMIKEIKDLKIASYEEKLAKHKVELKYLQSQLKPHFYLNAINTISSLSLQNKNKEIRKFIMALSQYLRYLFTDNLALVTLKSELDHAVDYIKLQQIKHPHLIFYLVELDEAAEGYLLPKLTLHTFIENIIKHAFSGEEMLSVFIKAEVVTADGEKLAQITIEDNGDGFDEAMLAAGSGGHSAGFGIDNVEKTLQLTFGRDDLVRLSNRDEGGARVVIRIPERGLKVEDHESADY
jgi:two-component system, sensor histidine kinase YesM